MLYIGSPHDGGLYKYDEELFKIDIGNVRGVTFFENDIYYIKDDAIFTLNGKLFNLPAKLGHDCRYYNGLLYLMATEMRTLYQFSLTGKIKREMKFDVAYWANCCWPLLKGLLVFLSAKRPYSKSKIVFFDNDWNFNWEYNCFENDEIHSPFVFNDDLYWCRSNRNAVVKASLSSKLRDIKKVLINNDGYTRGLVITKDLIIVGTSENRHSENSLCQAKQQHGCIHFYNLENCKFQKTIHLDCKEVYDIISC